MEIPWRSSNVSRSSRPPMAPSDMEMSSAVPADTRYTRSCAKANRREGYDPMPGPDCGFGAKAVQAASMVAHRRPGSESLRDRAHTKTGEGGDMHFSLKGSAKRRPDYRLSLVLVVLVAASCGTRVNTGNRGEGASLGASRSGPAVLNTPEASPAVSSPSAPAG